MRKTPLQRAVAAAPFAGNQSAFAKAIGTSQQNISNWLKRGARLPGEFVLPAERATGVSRHVWRPDLYPPQESRPTTSEIAA